MPSDSTFGLLRFSRIPGSSWFVVPVVLGQILTIIVVYQVATDFSCIGSDQQTACTFARSLVGRAVVLFAVFALYALARRAVIAALLSARAPGDLGWRRWAGLELAGFALIMAPIALFDPAGIDFFLSGAPFWAAGAVAAAIGAVFWLAPPAAWLKALRTDPVILPVLAGVGFLMPDLVLLADPIWSSSALTRLTFSSVTQVLTLFGAEPMTDPAHYVIGVGDFVVQVAASCSGVQGFALITAFVLFYAWIFRAETRFPHFWIVLPVAVALSWAFNVLRIAALIAIGAAGAPDLAVNGFHSHAGWVFFTLLSLGVMLAARAVPALRALPSTAREQGSAPSGTALPPFFEDWSVAQLLPFVVFMASALLASALVDPPALAYPLRAAAMFAALWPFRRLYLRLEWRLDPLSLGAGLAIGVLWFLTEPPANEADAALFAALAAMGPLVSAVWLASRLAGTALLVPLIEELVFRGYVLERLDKGGLAMRILAIAVSCGLFAALHDRWLAAGLAGLVFALLTLRSGRLTDAIQAHAVANAVIAAWAVATGAPI